MSLKKLRVVSAFSVLACTAPLFGTDTPPVNSTPPAAAPVVPAPHDHETTELGEHMDKIGDAFKKLRRQVSDATKNASSLSLVSTMQKEAEASAKLTPAKAQDLPEADRPKFMADYQEQMRKFRGMLDQLATALKANDNASAEKIVKDLGAFQRESHHEFRKPQKQG